ncbi:MAG: ligase [Flavipsychrobacter sp.]|jgi:bifunctional non-homologous end joining protein LigD|nr:ligase [Flavipsychrobacter sp.]
MPVTLTPSAPAKKKYYGPRDSAKSQKFKNFIVPMTAKLHDEPFNSPEWIFEIKWDGYRAIAETGKNRRLYSRNGLSFEEHFPIIYDELKKIKKNVVIDGEIVALDSKGRPQFQLIQQYAQTHDVPLCYYVFDCLYINGKSVKDKPLLERKQLLKELLPESDLILYCDHIEQQGKKFFAAVGKKGLEGMIAKRADSIYRENFRSSEWLKVKHVLTEEAVIAGYTQSRGSRKYFGALVLGIYKKGKFIYIGHTGTGFTHATLKEVYEQLQPLKTERSPFDTDVPVNMPVTWVKPKLVCNLKYTEVTEGGQRRHPVFLGLRIDKAAKDVHEELIS